MAEEQDTATKIGWWVMNGFCWMGLFSGLGLVAGIWSFERPETSRTSEVVVGIILVGVMVLMIKTFKK